MKLTWFAVSHPNRLIKDFHDFFLKTVLYMFVNLSLFWKNKKYKKKFMLIKFYVPHSEK